MNIHRRLSSIIRNRGTRAIPVKIDCIRLNEPIVTFTFDDFAKSAWTEGGRLVEGYGGRATYYASGNLCKQTIDDIEYYNQDDLREIVSHGHDLGCHTFDHVAIPGCTAQQIEQSIARNAEFLKQTARLNEISSFAYPFGLASIRTKRLLRDKFLACRGVYPAINSGWTDFSQLSTFCLHGAKLPIDKLLQQTLRRSGWLIFTGHDVSENPSPYGCTPQTLEETLKHVVQAGIRILTVDAALRRILGKHTLSSSVTMRV